MAGQPSSVDTLCTLVSSTLLLSCTGCTVQYTEQHTRATRSNQEPRTLHRLLNTLEVGDHGHLFLLLLGVHLGMVSLTKPFLSDVFSLEVVLCTAALLGSAEWFRKTGYSC